jgi:RNA polymerase sigma-70 factor (ECF subfamily)
MSLPARHLRLVPPEPAPVEPRPTPAPALDDIELLNALREGDPSAAASLYDRARPVVDRAIRRILGRRDRDHDDLAQMSMIALIESIDRFRGECALDGWISTVTAHTVFKHLRRRKTESRIFEAEMMPEAKPSHGPSPEKSSSLRSAVARIREHLDQLEPNKAWTFLLHDVCGYDLREIADITEVSVVAAQGRLSRGRRELLAKLREDPELAEMLEEMASEVGR